MPEVLEGPGDGDAERRAADDFVDRCVVPDFVVVEDLRVCGVAALPFLTRKRSKVPTRAFFLDPFEGVVLDGVYWR